MRGMETSEAGHGLFDLVGTGARGLGAGSPVDVYVDEAGGDEA